MEQSEREKIRAYVKEWMQGHGKDTFPLTERGECMYTKGAVSLNLVCFFEDLLEEYIDEQREKELPSQQIILTHSRESNGVATNFKIETTGEITPFLMLGMLEAARQDVIKIIQTSK